MTQWFWLGIAVAAAVAAAIAAVLLVGVGIHKGHYSIENLAQVVRACMLMFTAARFVLAPLAIQWAMNTVLNTQLPYNWQTYLSVMILHSILSGILHPSVHTADSARKTDD